MEKFVIKSLWKLVFQLLGAVVAILGVPVTIYGLCYPGFFVANSTVLATGMTTLLVASVFWFFLLGIVSVILYDKIKTVDLPASKING